jgi:hypothetical protein
MWIATGERTHKLAAKAADEFKRLTVTVAYLWVIFAVFVMVETVALGDRHISIAWQGFAIINAFALGKVLLVGERLKYADRFKDHALIYPILYKSLAFSILIIVVHIGESLLIGLWHGRSAADSVGDIGGGSVKGFVCVAAILFISLIPFFAFREIGRVIGEQELWNLIFKRRGRTFKLQCLAG